MSNDSWIFNFNWLRVSDLQSRKSHYFFLLGFDKLLDISEYQIIADTSTIP